MVSSKLTIGCYFRKQMLAGGELPFTWKCYNLKVKGYKGGNCTIPAYVEAKKHLNLPRKSHRVTCQSLSPKIPNIDFPTKMADSRVVSQVLHMLAIYNSKDTTQVQPLRWPACNSQGHHHPKNTEDLPSSGDSKSANIQEFFPRKQKNWSDDPQPWQFGYVN